MAGRLHTRIIYKRGNAERKTSCKVTGKMKTSLVCFVFVVFLTSHASGFAMKTKADAVDERVVGGSMAPEGAAPYQVSLRDRSMSHFCGGSIVGDSWILTAAHCVIGMTPAVAVVGTNQLRRGGTSYKISKVIPHPSYDKSNMRHDIAMLKTATKIVYNDKVQSIYLPVANLAQGASLILTGWGKTSHPGSAPNDLQIINLRSLDLKECQSRIGYNKVYDTQICTLNKVGQGACHGDSGGPLVSNGRQVGVVSFGYPCAKGSPDVFTKVQAYNDWIQRVANTNKMFLDTNLNITKKNLV